MPDTRTLMKRAREDWLEAVKDYAEKPTSKTRSALKKARGDFEKIGAAWLGEKLTRHEDQSLEAAKAEGKNGIEVKKDWKDRAPVVEK